MAQLKFKPSCHWGKDLNEISVTIDTGHTKRLGIREGLFSIEQDREKLTCDIHYSCYKKYSIKLVIL